MAKLSLMIARDGEFAAKVIGVGMEPEYPDGCYVVFTPHEPPSTGDVCLIETSDGALNLGIVDLTFDNWVQVTKTNKPGEKIYNRSAVRKVYKAIWKLEAVNKGNHG